MLITSDEIIYLYNVDKAASYLLEYTTCKRLLRLCVLTLTLQ